MMFNFWHVERLLLTRSCHRRQGSQLTVYISYETCFSPISSDFSYLEYPCSITRALPYGKFYRVARSTRVKIGTPRCPQHGHGQRQPQLHQARNDEDLTAGKQRAQDTGEHRRRNALSQKAFQAAGHHSHIEPELRHARISAV